MKNNGLACRLLLLIFLFFMASHTAIAQIYRLDVQWSGESFGNAAQASGFIIFDSASLPLVGDNSQIYIPSAEVTDLGITVSGASSGNGTFNINDFSSMYFSAPSPLDLSSQLIGQALSTGSTYGTSSGSLGDGLGGDFNLVAFAADAPNADWYFKLITDNGFGNPLLVTSMLATPVTTEVPLPPAVWLFGSALGVLGWFARYRSMS